MWMAINELVRTHVLSDKSGLCCGLITKGSMLLSCSTRSSRCEENQFLAALLGCFASSRSPASFPRGGQNGLGRGHEGLRESILEGRHRGIILINLATIISFTLSNHYCIGRGSDSPICKPLRVKRTSNAHMKSKDAGNTT